MRTIPVALLLLAPLSAQDEPPSPTVPPPSALAGFEGQDAQTLPTGNILREWRCAATKLAGEQYRVCRDPASWDALWKEHDGGDAPKVDFEHEMVVAAAREGHEITWARVTRVGTPGRSKLWVNLCGSPAKVRCHIAVMARSDLAVEFWLKDPDLHVQINKEPERGGIAVDAKLVRGAEPAWAKALPKLSDEQQKEAREYLKLLDSTDVAEREQGQRGLIRFGARARELLEPLAASSDAEAKSRALAILEHLPTFDLKVSPLTREQAVFIAREFVSKEYPTQFTNDPDMRWEDGGVRYTAGPHWRVLLRYL